MRERGEQNRRLGDAQDRSSTTETGLIFGSARSREADEKEKGRGGKRGGVHERGRQEVRAGDGGGGDSTGLAPVKTFQKKEKRTAMNSLRKAEERK